MRSGRPFPVEWTVDVLRQVCEGLHRAHVSGLVHGDLKPSDVRVNSEGIVKIVDFGVAALKPDDRGDDGRLLSGVHYRAPELIEGRRPDARSDVFSVGAIFYELLASRKPFPADTVTGVMFRIRHEDADPAALPPTDFSPGLEAVVVKALRRARAVRYSSLEELREDLVELVKETAPASPPARPAFLRRPRKKRPRRPPRRRPPRERPFTPPSPGPARRGSPTWPWPSCAACSTSIPTMPGPARWRRRSRPWAARPRRSSSARSPSPTPPTGRWRRRPRSRRRSSASLPGARATCSSRSISTKRPRAVDSEGSGRDGQGAAREGRPGGRPGGGRRSAGPLSPAPPGPGGARPGAGRPRRPGRRARAGSRGRAAGGCLLGPGTAFRELDGPRVRHFRRGGGEASARGGRSAGAARRRGAEGRPPRSRGDPPARAEGGGGRGGARGARPSGGGCAFPRSGRRSRPLRRHRKAHERGPRPVPARRPPGRAAGRHHGPGARPRRIARPGSCSRSWAR